MFRAPRPLVWALVADTNRWDRAAGLQPGKYEWRHIDGRRQRVGSAVELLALPVVWVERPYRWIEGRFLHGERQFLEGPLSTGGFIVRLKDAPTGTHAEAIAYVEGDGPVALASAQLMKRRFRAGLRRFFGAIEDALRNEVPQAEEIPAIEQARRLLGQSYSPVTSGVRSDTNAALLRARMDSIPAVVSQELKDRLTRFLLDQSDDAVAQIRPFDAAELWGADRRDVLRLFLYATRAGVVDLRWQVNCPVCRVAADVREGLGTVGTEVHCDACDIGYGVDFGEHIEAVFQCHPAIREVTAAVYCASSPYFLPHVYAQLRLAPGAREEHPLELPPGQYLVRVLNQGPGTPVTVKAPGAGLRIEVKAEPSSDPNEGASNLLEVSVETDSTRLGETLSLRNRQRDESTVLIERVGWSAPMALGSVVASFPEFVHLFATEAPAAGVELSVGQVTLLFSDLTGSTALYEEIGDARAFALVEKHFRIVEDIVSAHRGGVVKTMGDAVMATFRTPGDAVRAAIEIVDKNRPEVLAEGVGVKLGVHRGPCLAVRANDRLDYFGTTVNVAARLQGKAGVSELVVTEALADDEAVRPLLEPHSKRRFNADLKGIEGTVALVAAAL